MHVHWNSTPYFTQVIDEEKLMENSHHVGTYLLHSLGKLRKKYEIVGDVRGKGLMIGVELVKDKVRLSIFFSFTLIYIYVCMSEYPMKRYTKY